LKRQRERRKLKHLKEKERINDIKIEEMNHINEQINRSMLEEDEIWSKIQGGIKLENNVECFST